MAQQSIFEYFKPRGNRAIAAFEEYKNEKENPHNPTHHNIWRKSRYITTNVHTFNCGSSSEGTIHILDQQFHNLQAHIIILTGTRQQYDSTEETEHFTWHHLSRSIDNNHTGISFGISHQWAGEARINQRYTLTIQSGRCALLRISGPKVDISLVGVYAPVEARHDPSRQLLFKNLQDVIKRTPKRSFLIVGSDMNTSLHTSRVNSSLLEQVIENCALKASSDLPGFPRDGFSYCQAGKTSLIDYILIRKTDTIQVRDVGGPLCSVQMRKGISDHFPVYMTISVPTFLSRNNKARAGATRTKNRILNWQPIAAQYRKSFLPTREQAICGKVPEVPQLVTQIQASTRLLMQGYPEAGTIEDKWQHIKKALSPDLPDTEIKPRKEWISERTLHEITLRTDKWGIFTDLINHHGLHKNSILPLMKKGIPQDETVKHMTTTGLCDAPTASCVTAAWHEWRQLKADIQKHLREDRQAHYDDAVNQMKVQAARNQISAVWTSLKRIAGERRVRKAVLNNESERCTTDEMTAQAFSQHQVSTMAARSDPTTQPHLALPALTVNQVLNEINGPEGFSIADVHAALASLNWGKATPTDTPPSAVYAISASEVAPQIFDLLVHIIAAGCQPDDWKQTQMAWLLKSDKPPCLRTSYRGVSLIETTAKVATRLSENVISRFLNPPAAFAGSIAGRSTHDLVWTANEVLRRAREHGRQLTMVLVDATAAFDSVEQHGILKALRKSGAPDWAIRLQVLRLQGVRTTTKVGNATSTVFRTRGVPQGSPSGSTLFNYSMIDMEDDLRLHDENLDTRDVINKYDYRLYDENLRRLYFVDDILNWIMSVDKSSVEEDVGAIARELGKRGVMINNKKTVILCTGRKTKAKHSFVIGGLKVEASDCARYLGTIIRFDASHTSDMAERLSLARNAFFRLKKVWRSVTIDVRDKLNVYSASVVSILSYGAEIRPVLRIKHMMTRFESFHAFCVRYITNTWKELSNQDLRKKYGIMSIDTLFRKQRLMYWTNVASNPERKPSVVATFIGKFAWEKTKSSNPMFDTLTDDALRLDCINNTKFAAKTPSRFLLNIKDMPHRYITSTLSHLSDFDRANTLAVVPEEDKQVVCTLCGKKFLDGRGLFAHQRRTHKRAHPIRGLISTPTCPLCKKEFANLDGCRTHWQRVCHGKCPLNLLTALRARATLQPVVLGRNARQASSAPCPLSLLHHFSAPPPSPAPLI
jgi:hypothetical protein